MKFEKTIPFRKRYNHFGYNTDFTGKKINFSLSSKRAEIYKIVKDWIKDYKKASK